MAEGTESEELTFRIDPEEVAMVDRLHPGSDVCPTCKNTTWYIIQRENRVVPALPFASDTAHFSQPGAMRILALACQKCGFLRTYSLPIYEDYVKELKNGK